MGIIRSLFHVLTLGVVDSNKEHKRKNTPFMFSGVVTEEVFRSIAIETAKPIKRLTVTTENEFVIGEVLSVSGISTWIFILDFNDYGKITGQYWYRKKGNVDSQIPEIYAKRLKDAILLYIKNTTRPKLKFYHMS